MAVIGRSPSTVGGIVSYWETFVAAVPGLVRVGLDRRSGLPVDVEGREHSWSLLTVLFSSLMRSSGDSVDSLRHVPTWGKRFLLFLRCKFTKIKHKPI